MKQVLVITIAITVSHKYKRFLRHIFLLSELADEWLVCLTLAVLTHDTYIHNREATEIATEIELAQDRLYADDNYLGPQSNIICFGFQMVLDNWSLKSVDLLINHINKTWVLCKVTKLDSL